MKKVIVLLLVVILSISIVGCTSKEDEVIKMGFIPARDGDTLIESVEPLAEMLSKELGIKVEGFTATNYVGVVEGLGSGQVDFGFMPPFSYVLANNESNAQLLLTALNKEGEAKYRSQFLVKKGSDIKSFSDIKGKKVAFVDPSSTSGYLFPGAHLIKEGMDIEKDIEYVYAGGHDKALQLLLNGDVDVATTFVDSRDKYKKDFPDAIEKTEVLGYTDYIPYISVTVRGDMEDKLKEKIKTALLNIAETEEGLTLLKDLFNVHGFAEVKDEDYDIIRTTAETMNVNLKDAD